MQRFSQKKGGTRDGTCTYAWPRCRTCDVSVSFTISTKREQSASMCGKKVFISFNRVRLLKNAGNSMEPQRIKGFAIIASRRFVLSQFLNFDSKQRTVFELQLVVELRRTRSLTCVSLRECRLHLIEPLRRRFRRISIHLQSRKENRLSTLHKIRTLEREHSTSSTLRWRPTDRSLS